MGAFHFTKLADWFERQSQRRDIPLAEQLMLENVSAWLRSQTHGGGLAIRRRDPWTGLSNE